MSFRPLNSNFLFAQELVFVLFFNFLLLQSLPAKMGIFTRTNSLKVFLDVFLAVLTIAFQYQLLFSLLLFSLHIVL